MEYKYQDKKDLIKNFTDLIAWKKAHTLVLETYACLKRFPQTEKFALSSQMRRAAVSITSNIAEGFGRNTAKDKIQFYATAKGSLLELQSQLIISRDIGYVSETDFNKFDSLISEVARLLNGLMKSAPSK